MGKPTESIRHAMVAELRRQLAHVGREREWKMSSFNELALWITASPVPENLVTNIDIDALVAAIVRGITEPAP